MADVSMRRLREMQSDAPDRICADKYEEQEMAAELIRLREIIGDPHRIMRAARVVVDVPREERNRCRALLEAGE